MINTELNFCVTFHSKKRLKRTENEIRVIQSQGVPIFEVTITAARRRSAYQLQDQPGLLYLNIPTTHIQMKFYFIGG